MSELLFNVCHALRDHLLLEYAVIRRKLGDKFTTSVIRTPHPLLRKEEFPSIDSIFDFSDAVARKLTDSMTEERFSSSYVRFDVLPMALKAINDGISSSRSETTRMVHDWVRAYSRFSADKTDAEHTSHLLTLDVLALLDHIPSTGRSASSQYLFLHNGLPKSWKKLLCDSIRESLMFYDLPFEVRDILAEDAPSHSAVLADNASHYEWVKFEAVCQTECMRSEIFSIFQARIRFHLRRTLSRVIESLRDDE